jgi:hypothetical protein
MFKKIIFDYQMKEVDRFHGAKGMPVVVQLTPNNPADRSTEMTMFGAKYSLIMQFKQLHADGKIGTAELERLADTLDKYVDLLKGQ